jgi:hypothetical protein
MHGNVLKGVEEAIADTVVQSSLGDFSMAVKVVVAKDVQPFLAFAAPPVSVDGQAKLASQGDAEQVGGQAVVWLGAWGRDKMRLTCCGD